MLKFSANNKVFSVVFDHDSVKDRRTKCFVYEGVGKKGDPLVTEAAAYCHSKDNFCRRTGRKIAFKRAVSNLTLLKKNFDQKDVRKTAWDEFFKYFQNDPWSERKAFLEEEIIKASQETQPSR